MSVSLRFRFAPRRLGVAFALAIGVGAASPARAVEPLEQLDIVLLQPGSVIEKRVEGGADAMAGYIRQLAAAATDAMRANPQQIPTAGFIVVAARPDGRAHAWFDFKPALGDKTAAALSRAVESTAPTFVRSGDVVFALRVSLWGARPPATIAPSPPEWKDAAHQAGHPLAVDALVDRLWPQQ